ncbi:DUF3822 family protein [Aestuariibaculum suncheonense]|uniref:DUF3822 family protein n=1 Tax=Aestuariibaculum suncheonense TaxID=1028745 RepID=A0A8J6Q683_9FLAO|nr:DUF3822 family protein [Aestuariibaculum suncheonense]MBD0834979.1 DUF3822 family protein [Aestuariibaculum suncheonense]
MAQANKELYTLTNKDLSIQISLSGLSFCILQRDTQTITLLSEINFGKKLNYLVLLDYLKKAIETTPDLQDDFDNITVVHDNDLSNLVPMPLFDEDHLADYLKFNAKILKSDYIATDDIVLNDSVNVYVPFININNFIYETFGEFTFKHVSSVLIENILLIEKNAETPKVYANIAQEHFELIVVDKTKLLLYNTFEYSTKEDFIYYILFATEQLNLNPETFQLILLGDVIENDELYNMAYKYIRFVSFGSRNDNYNYTEAPKTNHSNFTLINSF